MKIVLGIFGVCLLALLGGFVPVLGPTGTVIGGLVCIFAGRFWWGNRSRRPTAEGFRFVYINADGGARELTGEEQELLHQKFAPTDGARPYIKFRYESRDGWGNLSGFIERRKVPAGIAIVATRSETKMKMTREREGSIITVPLNSL